MGLPAQETDNQAEATRHEILRAAEGLFGHYGFSKTNISDIAKECGMSPANLYRYFRNKAAIGLAVVGGYFDMAEAAMEAELMLPKGGAEERVRNMMLIGVGHLVREMEVNPKIVELAEFICSDAEGRERLFVHIHWKRDVLAREIRRGIESGEFKPGDADHLAHTLLLATKVFWMPHGLADWQDRATVLPELTQVLDLLFSGMRASGGDGG